MLAREGLRRAVCRGLLGALVLGALVLGALVLGAGLGAGCDGDGHRTRVAAGECITCHRAEYVAATDPAHAGAYPTACGECHGVEHWIPAFGPHPESAFPIATGPHDPYRCSHCHDPALDVEGSRGDLTCVSCHHEVHELELMATLHRGVRVPLYPDDPKPDPAFCLDCHPSGREPIPLHPERSFPLSRGGHARLRCAHCHDAGRGENAGGENTDCAGCHAGTHARVLEDARHREVEGYPPGEAPPSFCVGCHLEEL